MTTPPSPPNLREIPRYTRNSLPLGEWQTFRKKTPTEMVRVLGPFVVETDGGPILCNDGWLAKDARGHPYPVAAEEHQLVYEPAEPED